VRQAERDAAGRARGRLGDGRARVGHLLQDGLRMFIKDLAGIGAEDAVGRAVQQLGAEFFLELAQLLGQRRLRHVQHQRRARQRAVVDDGDEIAELA
jgi:hypothetical protein